MNVRVNFVVWPRRAAKKEGIKQADVYEHGIHSPGIDDPDEGGVIVVPEVARQGVLCEEVPIEDPPASPVRAVPASAGMPTAADLPFGGGDGF